MKFHFTLEYRRLSRLIHQAGFNPARVMIISGILIFFLIIYLLLLKDIPFSLLGIVVLVSVSLAFRKSRTSFYSSIYPRTLWLKIKAAETVLLTSPIFLIFLFSENFLIAFSFLIFALVTPFLLASLEKLKQNIKPSPFPTPFKHYPFEFTRGFRMAWPVYLFTLFFFHKGVELENPNFGVFALLVAVLIPGFFFSKPEPVSLVTIYSENPKGFLNQKIRLILRNSLLLSIPFVLLALFLFPSAALLVLGALAFGLLFSVSAMLGKYAYFPNEMNPVQSTSLILSLMMPPILLLILPAFYKKALSNLKPFLS